MSGIFKVHRRKIIFGGVLAGSYLNVSLFTDLVISLLRKERKTELT